MVGKKVTGLITAAHKVRSGGGRGELELDWSWIAEESIGRKVEW